MKNLPLLVLAFVVASCSSLLVQPRLAQPRVASRVGMPKMQLGGKPEREGLTRENEPDEFFSTNMDDMSDAEKLKSPVVIGGLAILIAPFIVGAIALAFYR